MYLKVYSSYNSINGLENAGSPDNRSDLGRKPPAIYSSNKFAKSRTLSDSHQDENINEKHQPVIMGRGGGRIGDYSSVKVGAQYDSNGTLGGIEPNRKPMSVEEMLKLKKKNFLNQNK